MSNSNKRSRKDALRERAAQKRRRQSLIVYGAVAGVVALIAVIVFINVWSNRPVGDEQAFASQGNLHIPDGTASQISYNSTPPSSGPHYERLAGWGVYEEPLPYERLIHNLEDGGVAIYYQCEDGCPDTVAQLKEIAQPLIDRGRHVILAPNQPGWDEMGTPHEDIGAPIALVAWQRVDKLDAPDADRIMAFIERYEGIDNH